MSASFGPACITAAAMLLLAVGACSKDTSGAEAKRAAQSIWDTRCMNCHGRSGAGDGPQARLLDPKPRQLNNLAWQQTVTDEHLRTVIVQGGQVVGKSPLMAANPDLADKPAVVEALVAHIRGL